MVSFVGYRQHRMECGYKCRKDIESSKILRFRLRAKKCKSKKSVNSKKSLKKKFRNITAAGIFGYSVLFSARILANQNYSGSSNEVIEPSIERVVPTSMEADGLLPASVDQQVILVKKDDIPPSGQPSQFLTPPSGGRPSRNVPGVNPYRGAPKIVPGQGAGAAEQCELDENGNQKKLEIVYRIKENPVLVREAEIAGRDQAAQRSLNNLVEQLAAGNRNPGIGTEHVFKNVYELRGRNRARVYYREVDGKIEILAKSVKSNQGKVIKTLKQIYD